MRPPRSGIAASRCSNSGLYRSDSTHIRPLDHALDPHGLDASLPKRVAGMFRQHDIQRAHPVELWHGTNAIVGGRSGRDKRAAIRPLSARCSSTEGTAGLRRPQVCGLNRGLWLSPLLGLLGKGARIRRNAQVWATKPTRRAATMTSRRVVRPPSDAHSFVGRPPGLELSSRPLGRSSRACSRGACRASRRARSCRRRSPRPASDGPGSRTTYPF